MKIFYFCILFVSSAVFAAPEIVPPQEMAMGQSLAGSALLNDSLYSNPASSAFSQVYSVEGSYFPSGGFGASVLDTRTSNFGAIAGYYRKNVSYSKSNSQGVKLGLSSPLSSMVGVGMTGKILWGPSLNGGEGNLKDVDLGVISNLGFLRMGGYVRNIFGGDAGLEQNREWGLGAQISYQKILSLSVSSLFDWDTATPIQYGVGTEYISPYHFSLKGGYRWLPQTPFRYWGVGASFLGPRLCVHYGVEIPASEGLETEHILSVSIFM